MKHTPGPWNVRRMIPESSEYLRCIKTPDFEHIAHVCDLEGASDEALANAALIAAAPDLLAALSRLLESDLLRLQSGVESGPRIHRDIDEARAAIAKACPQGQDNLDTEK
jgi:hypothetical protein